MTSKDLDKIINYCRQGNVEKLREFLIKFGDTDLVNAYDKHVRDTASSHLDLPRKDQFRTNTHHSCGQQGTVVLKQYKFSWVVRV